MIQRAMLMLIYAAVYAMLMLDVYAMLIMLLPRSMLPPILPRVMRDVTRHCRLLLERGAAAAHMARGAHAARVLPCC